MPRSLRTLAVLLALGLAAAVLPLAWAPADAAPDGAGFRPLAGFEPTGGDVRVRPEHYAATRVDLSVVHAALEGAPHAGSAGSEVFSVPTPSGGSERFAVQRTQLMQPGLAAAHPEISTWSGESLDHPGTTVAMDLTPMGFHASVRPADGQGTWYVDPAYNEPGTTQHLSYYGGSLPRETQRFVERELPAVQRAAAEREAAAPGAPVRQRVYRLALATDPSYARYFGADNVTAEKVTLLNRVNQVYNDDLAIDLVLIDDNDKLNLDTSAEATGANGPCGAHPCFDPPVGTPGSSGYQPGQLDYCDVPTLVRNQVVLGQLVGADSYDIGHLMLGVNGGGIAELGAVGGAEKAQGCTGLPDPVGDFMALDYVAHEMGHQFGGNHTFNGVQSACSGGNRVGAAAVEPGSGSSVMAYAGICRQDDLQPHTDPYFSQRTLTEVHAYTTRTLRHLIEVQDVSLTGFDGSGESITLTYPGSAQAFTLVRGGAGASAYNAANLQKAVEALTGEDVTITGWGYDPYAGSRFPAPATSPDRTGFEVTFAGDLDPRTDDSHRRDMDPLEVSSSSPGVSAQVGETVEGGQATGNRGYQVNPTDNHDPVVEAPADRTIPVRTPFTLSGSGTDADGDHLVYLWEQNDDAAGHHGTRLVSNDKRFGPLFRVFGRRASVTDGATLTYHSPGENHATADATRTFPDLRQVLSGNTNARSGRCPKVAAAAGAATSKPVPTRAVNCYSEFLPTAGYHGTPGKPGPAMHFRLTARDRRAGGGGVGHDDVTLRVARDAGPFLVSSFAGGRRRVHPGDRKTLRWEVNGTRRLAHRVRVLLSTDDGRTWSTALKKRTPNDGKAVVRVPHARSGHAWLMVKAVGNYFFDVADTSFRIR